MPFQKHRQVSKQEIDYVLKLHNSGVSFCKIASLINWPAATAHSIYHKFKGGRQLLYRNRPFS